MIKTITVMQISKPFRKKPAPSASAHLHGVKSGKRTGARWCIALSGIGGEKINQIELFQSIEVSYE